MPRYMILGIGSGLVLASGWHAAVFSLSSIQPSLAIKLDSTDPDSIARTEALNIARKMEDGQPIHGSAVYLRQVLRSDPLNVLALRLLAITIEGASEEKPNYRLLTLANRVTRRDLGVQALLVREEAKREDVAGALSAYDDALRTSAISWELLFPGLAQAIETEGFEVYFNNILENEPPWLSQFLVFAIGQTDNPEVYFDLLIRPRAIDNLSRKDEIANGLINRLVATGNLQLAKTAFRATNSGDMSILTSPDLALSEATGRRNALNWQFSSSGGVGAQLIGGGVLNIFADAGRTGTVARKILFLERGSYLLTAGVDRQATTGALVWESTCLGGVNHGQAIGFLPPKNESIETNGSASWQLTVPERCEAISLRLQVSGGKQEGGSSILVEDIRVRPNT